MKKLFFLFVLAFVLLFSAYSFGTIEKPDVSILFTASLNGNLDGCRCQSNPRGGLITRAVYLREITNRDNIILLDAGDILDVFPDKLLAQEILEVYKELGYDVIGLGDQELINGFESLVNYKSNYPLIANNISLVIDGKSVRFSDSPEIFNKGGKTVGVFSVIEPECFSGLPDETTNKLEILPIEETVNSMLSELTALNVDLKVLLYHGTFSEAENLAENIHGIDIIIVAHEQKLVHAFKNGTTVLASPGGEGNRVAQLDIFFLEDGTFKFDYSFRYFELASDPVDPMVEERIRNYHEQLTIK